MAKRRTSRQRAASRRNLAKARATRRNRLKKAGKGIAIGVAVGGAAIYGVKTAQYRHNTPKHLKARRKDNARYHRGNIRRGHLRQEPESRVNRIREFHDLISSSNSVFGRAIGREISFRTTMKYRRPRR